MTCWHQFSIRQLLLLATLIAIFVVLAIRPSPSQCAADSLQSLGADLTIRRTNSSWLKAVFERTNVRVVGVKCEGSRFGDAELNLLDQLKDIEWLSLAKSRITDGGLARLSHVKKLRSLDLSGTGVSDLIALAGMTNLNKLSLRGTKIDDNDLRILDKLPGLASLDLAGTAIADAGLLYVKLIEHHSVVNLRGTKVTRKGVYDLVRRTGARAVVDWDPNSYVAKDCDDTALADLQWMPDLWELTLDSPKITDVGLRYLKHLPRLHKLKLMRCAITNDGLVSVGQCRGLTQLTLHSVPVSNAGIAHLRTLTDLQALDLSELAISDDALKYFADLNELELLVLSDTQVTGIGLRQMIPASKTHLVELVLRRSPVTTAGMREICRFPSLLFLVVSECPVSDDGIASLERLQKLCGIDLSKTDVTDKAIATLLKLPELTAIDLSGTRVTDAGVQNLRLPEGAVLRIADVPISETSIRSLKAKYPKSVIDQRSDGSLGNFVPR